MSPAPRQGLVVTVPLPGAAFRVGQTVRIVGDPLNETLDERFVGRVGVVEALVFDDPVRQYPEDPLVQVRVPALGRDLFFPHELRLARRDARTRARRRSEPRAPSLSSPPGRL